VVVRADPPHHARHRRAGSVVTVVTSVRISEPVRRLATSFVDDWGFLFNPNSPINLELSIFPVADFVDAHLTGASCSLNVGAKSYMPISWSQLMKGGSVLSHSSASFALSSASDGRVIPPCSDDE